MSYIDDFNVLSEQLFITPDQLHNSLPISNVASKTVTTGRQVIRNILDRTDPRLLVVVGPCSIHDPQQALDYAQRLINLSKEVDDTFYFVMRVYFEKPRTTCGWQGLINDPEMNGTFNIAEGMRIGRKLVMEIAELGLPAATEALDPIAPQYLEDLITWSSIGTRVVESQTHREMASGLSSAVGFKNGLDGLSVTINALNAVSKSHRFLGINRNGKVSVICTKGNAYGHILLRGGNSAPNYDSVSVALCEKALAKADVPLNIMIDCSHANSYKNFELQPLVMENVVNQILEGNQSIFGVMIESNLAAGSQKIPEDLSKLIYGVSVTDECIDWQTTENMLLRSAEKLRKVLHKRGALAQKELEISA